MMNMRTSLMLFLFVADAAVLANAAAKFYADDAEEELVSHW